MPKETIEGNENVNEVETPDLISKKLLDDLMYGTVNWDEYKSLPNKVAYDLIDNGYGHLVLENCGKFNLDEDLFNALADDLELNNIDIFPFHGTGLRLSKNTAISRIDSGNGDLLVVHSDLFDGLDQEVAKKMATRGILHQLYRDFIKNKFGLSEEETEKLYKYSEEQEKIIRKLESEDEEARFFEDGEIERLGR